MRTLKELLVRKIEEPQMNYRGILLDGTETDEEMDLIDAHADKLDRNAIDDQEEMECYSNDYNQMVEDMKEEYGENWRED